MRVGKRRVTGHHSGGRNQSRVTHHDREEDLDNSEHESETLCPWNFAVVADELLTEARDYAADLSEKPSKALDLLFKQQSTISYLQAALDSHVRMLVVLEAGTIGSTFRTNYRHVVSVFSQKLIHRFARTIPDRMQYLPASWNLL